MRRFLALLLAIFAPTAAWAGSYDMFGTGSRAIAMGGAYTALGDDISGLWYNVGAIPQVGRIHAEVGYSYAQPNMIINGTRQDLDQHRGTTAGGIVSASVFDHRVSIGVNLFLPDAHGMRFLVLPIDQPHHMMASNANHTFTSLMGLGVKVFPWLSVGGGVQLLATELGGVNFTIKEDSPSEGSLVSELTPKMAPLAGIWVQPFDWWQAGFAFRDKVEMTLELPNYITIPPLKVFDGSDVQLIRETEMEIRAVTNCHFSPRSYEMGMAFRPLGPLLVSGNITYSEWSTMGSDAPDASVSIYGGLADVFVTKPGIPPAAPGFHDIWTPSFGTEYSAIDDDHWRLDVRGGYRYRPTPVPEQKSTNNYLDADTHIASGGLGITAEQISPHLPRSMKLDGFVQYFYSEPRIYHKVNPTDVLGDIEFSSEWWNVGGTLTLRF